MNPSRLSLLTNSSSLPMTHRILAVVTLLVLSAAQNAAAGTISDGDFTNWTITPIPGSAHGPSAASGAVLGSGGNPGAYVDTDMFFPGGYSPDAAHQNTVIGIKNDAFTTADIHGVSWSLSMDYLAETAGAYDIAGLAVKQGSSLFYENGTVIGGTASWQTLNESGTFTAGGFTRITGSDTLNFNGGVPTYFGLFVWNDTSYPEIKMGLDNWSLNSVASLPEPSTFVLGGLGIVALLIAARRQRSIKTSP